MIASREGRKLLAAALALGLDGLLGEDSFSKGSNLSWKRLTVVDGDSVRDSVLMVPHFGITRAQDSLEIHYRVRWDCITQAMAQANLPQHLTEASHIDASVGHLMPSREWREMNVHMHDTAETLGTALVAMWATVIRPFAERVRHLSEAASGPLLDERLTGPNRHWVRAAAFARLGRSEQASDALALLRVQRAAGEIDDDVALRLDSFAQVVSNNSGPNTAAR